MVEKKKLPIKIKGVPIYRASNGLALSSRNQRLHEDRKEASKIIYETLNKVNNWFKTNTISEIKEKYKTFLIINKGCSLNIF
jgi:pantoate--beta-alanine ligase